MEAGFVAETAGAYMVKVLPATTGELTSELRPATLSFRVSRRTRNSTTQRSTSHCSMTSRRHRAARIQYG